MKTGTGNRCKRSADLQHHTMPPLDPQSELAVRRYPGSLVVYVDGGGPNAHGVSGCAWIRPGTAFHVERGNGWTCNEAEYRGLVSALQHLPAGACATVLSDSLLMVRQYAREAVTSAPRLQILLGKARQIIWQRDLLIQLCWIPREENLADALLRLNIPGMASPLQQGCQHG